MNIINAVIIGASGYTGAELVRLLCAHPQVSINALVADSNAGKPIAEIYPHFADVDLPDLIKLDAVEWDDIDVAFCCLPHATSQEVIAALPEDIKIIDLSADFRIEDPAQYKKWYGHDHAALDLQKEAVYGLSEINAEKIREARLVACPGCYPTSMLLPLIPLLEKGLIKQEGIIVDSKSGITGAGRSARVEHLFAEINGGMYAYGIGGHRHVAEVEQELSKAADELVHITFTPQVVPTNRGILSTIYVTMTDGNTAEDLQDALAKRYEDAEFVHVSDKAPSTRHVYSTNHARMAVFPDRISGRAIIVSVLDNLVKGASGQAVQNMNLMFNLPEDEGLAFTPIFP